MPRRSKAPKLFKLVFFFCLILIIAFLVSLLWPKSEREEALPIGPDSTAIDSLEITDNSVNDESNLELPIVRQPVSSTSSDLDFLLGKTDFSRHPDFSYISDAKYVTQRIPIHKDVFEAFKQMQAAASEDQIHFRIVSAARSWARQKSIWENKLNILGYKDNLSRSDKLSILRQALRYNSHPGISRHHWGTDIDLNSVDLSYFETPKGKRELAWLDENAGRYGFVKAYTNDPERGGFSYEPWHWTWAPLSIALYKDYVQKVNYQSFVGFIGSELISEFDTIEIYVKGINPALK